MCDVCQRPFTGREPGERCSIDGHQPEGTLVRRKDDEPEAVRNRLAVYQRQTAPVIDWYRTHGAPLRFVDGMGTLDEVLGRIRVSLGI